MALRGGADPPPLCTQLGFCRSFFLYQLIHSLAPPSSTSRVSLRTTSLRSTPRTRLSPFNPTIIRHQEQGLDWTTTRVCSGLRRSHKHYRWCDHCRMHGCLASESTDADKEAGEMRKNLARLGGTRCSMLRDIKDGGNPPIQEYQALPKKNNSSYLGWRSPVGKFGVPPASARNIQIAIIQSTLLYESELSWTGAAPETKDYQLAITRMPRGTTGAFKSTPLGALLAESGLTPAVPLLDHRQSRYTQRILRQPEETRGAKEVLLATQNSALSQQIKKMSHLNGDRMEKTYLETGKAFMGEIMPHTNESEAMQFAEEWTDREDTAWTDESRLDDGRVGCSIVWQEETEGNGWMGQTIHLGTNKEVYDAERFAIEQAMRRFIQRGQPNRYYMIFSDSQSAVQRCMNDKTGPGQALANSIIDGSLILFINHCTVILSYGWTGTGPMPERSGFKQEISRVEKELKIESKHTQVISLGTDYTAMQVLSGKKSGMNKWMMDIGKCVVSGGEDCYAVKGIAEVYGKGIRKTKD
ncbi:hypothetical protein FPQ18DRAFT_309375 [Pyronema domesticum]|nr:hypothetical protein FPQ18DRAFT_309375 [Pyronema domesticum]